jgi:hypothetical protein
MEEGEVRRRKRPGTGEKKRRLKRRDWGWAGVG